MDRRGRVPSAELGGWRRHRPDYRLVVYMGILLLLGMVIIYSISPALAQRSIGGTSENFFVFRQLAYILAGLAAFAFTAIAPLSVWRRFLPILVIAALVTSVALLIPGIGSSVNGATRWINIAGLSFQPAELAKFALILYLAQFLAERTRENALNDRSRTLYPVMLMLGAVGLLVAILQKDLGTMMVFVAIVFGMLFVAKVPKTDLTIFLGTIGAAGVASILMFPHRLQRIFTFINPAADVDGTGYHINQALIAIGSGGWFGRGLGRSVQVFGYLPEPANDSIFAIFAEKFGFIGCLLVFILYGMLFVRILKILDSLASDYYRLIVAGVFAWLFSHVVINIGAMLSLMPLTGITLPFLSFGGTSLVFIMAGIGLVFNISRYTDLSANVKREGVSGEDSRYRWGNRRARFANSSRSLTP